MRRLIVFITLLVLTAGCTTVKSWLPSSSGTLPGDQMLSQSKQTKTLGKTWNHGHEMIEKGQKLLSKSEKLAMDAQKARLEAEGMIAQGNTLIENSERGYRTAFGEGPSMGATPVPTEASARDFSYR